MRRNKVSALSETRSIEVGGYVENDKRKHNKIKTSKYSLLTFVPKNLMEQFRRIANFYFLSVTAIAIIIDSPVSPMTSIVPLMFMVLVTAVKQGYEDWLRHRADDVVNRQMVEIIHKGVAKTVPTALVAPGMLVRVRSDRSVPADLVVLCASDPHGKCFITTANLDGETNLKTLRVPSPLLGYTPDMLPNGIRVKVPNPVADLYTFYGQLELVGRNPVRLTTENLMLRGATLENTEWVIGCAIYTGEETKLALNSKYAANKFSSCEAAVNGYLLFFIGILVAEVALSFVLKRVYDIRYHAHEVYLGEGTTSYDSVNDVLQDMFSFLLLYYYIIPMSLYVTIEFYKFFGSLFIKWDADLYCEETDQPAVANTSDLSEDLGQVEILFSDKTGTLTKNLMVFKACTVNGRIYKQCDGELYDGSSFNEREDLFQTDVKLFFTILALCHSVQVSADDMKKLGSNLLTDYNLRNGYVINDTHLNTNGRVNELKYHASSPDEKALVEAAAQAGVRFMGEIGNNLLLQIGNDKEMYEKLQIIEFSSERKRMSVIVKDKNGKIWLFCKGADNIVLDLCEPNIENETVKKDIENFAKKGLRILAVAYREIAQQEFDEVVEHIRQLQSANLSAIQKINQHFEVLEKSLTLIGATAVEDCLQDDVMDTLSSLRRAGIRIWVLTGDKVETAINVAQSCGHISQNEKRLFLIDIEDQSTLDLKLKECKIAMNEAANTQVNLIIDGTTMAEVLERPHAKLFAEIALKCNAVLCCRLSPIQKALIVKLVKQSPERPITAAIGDGANDISMIQEAHVGFGIYGKEGNQAVRSADFAFAKFSMLKKILLVLGHWYYQRLATLTLYFFYKNLMFVNFMLFFQGFSLFSTQSLFDSMYLTFFNLIFTSLPCLILSFTEQTRGADVLLREPELYMKNRKNRLMGWLHFGSWSAAAIYHSIVVYSFTMLTVRYSVIHWNAITNDLWSFGAAIFHYLVLIVNLKLWLHARYNTIYFVASVLLSIFSLHVFNLIYTNILVLQTDGDVLGTYLHLLTSYSFWFLSVLLIVATLLPDYCLRAVHDLWWRRKQGHSKTQNQVEAQVLESTRF